MSAPPVERLGDAILLRGDGVRDMANLARMGLKHMRSVDGMTPQPGLLALVDVLTRTRDEMRASTTMSVCGHARDSVEVGAAQSEATEIGAAEAAQILNRTARQVRRIAPDLGGRQVGGVWLFDRTTITAAAAARRRNR